MHQLISKLKTQNPDLRESEIEGILYIIKSQNVSNAELIQITGIAKPILKEFLSSIGNMLDKSMGDKLAYNKDATDLIQEVNPKSHKWTLISHSILEIETILNEIRTKYDLQPKREFDQFFATVNSSISKAQMLIDKGLVEGKDIVLLGDDDLVSIVLGLMNAPYSRIKILDIDSQILNTIKSICKEYNLQNIETEVYDAKNELGNLNAKRFDVVLIDPPYTRFGVQLFLHRSLELLRNINDPSGSYILLNFGVGNRSSDKQIKIQDIISNMGLVIEDKIKNYTSYHGAEIVGSSSDIYLLRTTPHTQTDTSVLNTEIYTFEVDPIEKFPYVDHYVFKIKNVSSDLIGSKKALLKAAGDFCNRHKLKVVDTHVTKFKGKGLSITFILASSNLLIHTWPEHNALHIDLVTCSPIYNKNGLGNTLSRLFDTNYIEVRRVE